MLTVLETRSQFAQRNKLKVVYYWQLDQLIQLLGDLVSVVDTVNEIQIYHIQFMHLIIKKGLAATKLFSSRISFKQGRSEFSNLGDIYEISVCVRKLL